MQGRRPEYVRKKHQSRLSLHFPVRDLHQVFRLTIWKQTTETYNTRVNIKLENHNESLLNVKHIVVF